MNGKQILETLKNKPRDEDVRVAIEWVKNRKPTSKIAHDVLNELVDCPQFEPELAWLEEWIRPASWSVLRRIAWNARSLVLYDWLIDFLERNPENEKTAEIWDALLMSYRDPILVDKAEKWLAEYGGTDSDSGLVAARVLEYRQTSIVKQKAYECAAANPDDFLVVAALVEYVGDSRSIELGLEFVRKADHPTVASFVAEALLEKDLRYVPVVEEMLRKFWNHGDITGALDQIMMRMPEPFLPLTMEWLRKHKRAQLGPSLLRFLLQSCPNEAIIQKTWSWLDKHREHHYATWTLVDILRSVDEPRLPKEVQEFAISWLHANREHPQWVSVASHLLRGLLPDNCARIGRELLMIAPQRLLKGDLLAIMVERSSDDGCIALATEWRRESAEHMAHKRLISVLLKCKPDEELIAQAKACLSSTRKARDWELLNALVEVKDQKSIGTAKDWLLARYLRKSYGGEFPARGELLVSLLKHFPGDKDVHELSEVWLRGKPHKSDRRTYQDVRDAYEAARGKAGQAI